MSEEGLSIQMTLDPRHSLISSYRKQKGWRTLTVRHCWAYWNMLEHVGTCWNMENLKSRWTLVFLMWGIFWQPNLCRESGTCSYRCLVCRGAFDPCCDLPRFWLGGLIIYFCFFFFPGAGFGFCWGCLVLCFPVSLVFCFSAFVLLCLSSSTIRYTFSFFRHVFLLLYFLLLCFFASCLYCLFVL